MKTTVVIIFVLTLTATTAVGQVFKVTSIYSSDCGTWKAKFIRYTEWVPLDSISKSSSDTAMGWVYSDWKHSNLELLTHAVYCPCGCGDDIVYTQHRVSRKTGLVQSRKKIQSFEYIPKEKTEFERVCDSVSNANKTNKPK